MVLHPPAPAKVRSLAHVAGEKAHLAYFGLVFIEGHGWYAIAAGVCLSLGLVWEFAGIAGIVGAAVGVASAAAIDEGV